MSTVNHKKIEILSKKTGLTTIVLDTSEGICGQIPDGIPITETMDDSLDTAVFVLKAAPRTLFDVFDPVTLTITEGDAVSKKELCVAADSAALYQRHKDTFEHTVTLAEETKLLEKYKIQNLNLTNRQDSLLRQAEKAINNAIVRVSTPSHEEPCLFRFSDGLRGLLDRREGEDFYFSDTDLRTVLDTILLSSDARCRVERIVFDGVDIREIVIGYRSLSELRDVDPVWTAARHGEIVNEERSNDAQDYAGKIIASGENTFTKRSVKVTDMFKSTEAVMTSENVMALLPMPISERGIKSFSVRVWFEYSYWVKQEHGYVFAEREPVDVDIGEYIIPAQNYDLLSAEEQKNYLFFEEGAAAVNANLQHKNFLFREMNIRRVMENALREHPEKYPKEYEIPEKEKGEYNLDNPPFYDSPFTCEYYPKITTHIDYKKPGVYDKDRMQLGIRAAQQENNLDLERHGRQLLSLIRRTGNEEAVIDVNAKRYSELLPLMARLPNGFVVYKREIALYDAFVHCRYYLSYDYTMVQSKAGINRGRHLYDIPIESVDCPLLVKQYMIFSKIEPQEKVDPTYKTDVLISAANTLLAQPDKRLRYLLFQTFSSSETFPQATENSAGEFPYEAGDRFMRPVFAYAQGKSVNYMATVYDNYSVDFSRDGYRFSLWSGGRQITYCRYVSKDEAEIGEVCRIDVESAFSCRFLDAPQDYPNYTDLVSLFPISDRAHYDSAQNAAFRIDYVKDRTQRPVFFGSVECIPAEYDYNDIVVGSAFCRENNLVIEIASTDRIADLYTSAARKLHDASESILGQDYILRGAAKDFFRIISHDRYIELRYIGAEYADVASWAIANKNGEVMLGANGSPTTVFVFMQHFPERAFGYTYARFYDIAVYDPYPVQATRNSAYARFYDAAVYDAYPVQAERKSVYAHFYDAAVYEGYPVQAEKASVYARFYDAAVWEHYPIAALRESVYARFYGDAIYDAYPIQAKKPLTAKFYDAAIWAGYPIRATKDPSAWIKFQNYDGKILQQGYQPIGKQASYSGQTPTRSADHYLYTFRGWSPPLGIVHGDATYTAEFDATPIVYLITIRYINQNGSVIGTENRRAAYGSTLTIEPPSFAHYSKPGMRQIVVYGNQTVDLTYTGVYYSAKLRGTFVLDGVERTLFTQTLTTQYPATLRTVFSGAPDPYVHRLTGSGEGSDPALQTGTYRIPSYFDAFGNLVGLSDIQNAQLTDNTAQWTARYLRYTGL